MNCSGPIQHSSERVLEFDQLRQLLAAYTASPLGQGRVMELTPSCARSWIERQQQLTEELRGYIRSGGRFDFHGLLDPTALIDKSRIAGAALEIGSTSGRETSPIAPPSGSGARASRRSRRTTTKP